MSDSRKELAALFESLERIMCYLVSEPLLASRKSSEVLGCLWHSLAVKTHHNASNLFIAVLDVEVDLVGDLWSLSSSCSSLSEKDKDDGQNDHQRDEESLNGCHCVDMYCKNCCSKRRRTASILVVYHAFSTFLTRTPPSRSQS